MGADLVVQFVQSTWKKEEEEEKERCQCVFRTLLTAGSDSYSNSSNANNWFSFALSWPLTFFLSLFRNQKLSDNLSTIEASVTSQSHWAAAATAIESITNTDTIYNQQKTHNSGDKQ